MVLVAQLLVTLVVAVPTPPSLSVTVSVMVNGPLFVP